MRNRTMPMLVSITGLAVAILLPAGAAVATAPSVVTTTPSQIGAARVDGSWFYDKAGDASFAVTKDGPGAAAALRMDLTSTADKVYLYNTFEAGSRPDDIPALLQGASYAYAGTNVNLQLEVIFEPSDVALYGPAGTAKPCTPASTWYGWGLTADTDWCYTVLKWEPYVRPGTEAWTTVDLSVDTAASSEQTRGGWVSSKNLGQYPGNVSLGQTMSTYLGEVADYEVTGFAFGVGSGTPGPTSGWMRDYTLGGVTYAFGADPVEPVGPPAADSDALQELIDAEDIDVDADTALFTPGEGNEDLDEVDPDEPLSGTFPWTEPEDFFVDVYAFSEPVHLGTFAVVGGVVQFSADISDLGSGTHHLVFVGQGSGAVAVVQFAVAAAAVDTPAEPDPAEPGPALAATGVDAWPLGLLALVLIGAGIAAMAIRRTA